MRKFMISIFLCGAIGTNLSGCGFVDGFKKGFSESTKKSNDITSNATNDSEKQFKDPNGKFEISVPKSWNELDEVKKSNQKFSIGIGNRSDETYAGTFAQSKNDFGDGMTLDKYSDLIVKSLKGQIKNNEFSEIKDAEINGCKAKTFLIKGEVKDIKASYIYAVIELPNSYVHVVTWTLTSRYDKNKDKLIKVINSFKEIK